MFVAVPFAIQAAVMFAYSLFVDRQEQLTLHQYHSKEALGRTNWLSTLYLSAAATAVATAATGDSDYRELYRDSKELIARDTPGLGAVLQDNGIQKHAFVQLQDNWNQVQSLLDAIASAPPRAVVAAAASPEMKTLWQKLYAARRAILLEEDHSFVVSLSDLEFGRHLLKTALNGIVALDLLLAAVLFYFYSRQIVDRVAIVTDNAARLAAGSALHDRVSGADEISALDETFHDMAQRLTLAKLQLETSEKRIRAILNDLPVGLFVLRPDESVEFANKTAGRLLRRSADSLPGLRLGSLLDIEGVDGLAELFEKSLVGPVEVQAGRSDQSTFRAELSGNVIEFADANRTLMALQDVTERHAIEQMRKDFVAMVCHDLRNPLTSIMLFQQMLENNMFCELDESGTTLLRHAQNCARSLMTLVNDMLESARLENADLPLLKSAAELDVIIGDAMAAVQGVMSARELTVSFAPSAIALTCDELKIVRVLSNLLGNAAKYSPVGSTISLIAERVNDCVRVSVVDSGPGIPEEMQQKIFDKFTQLSNKDARAGVGLGLSICKQFIEAHGGSIGVESQVGSGSIFWFTLPVEPQ